MGAFFIAILFTTSESSNEITMTLNEIMSASLITVEMDDSLKVVKDIFDNASIHHVLVVEQHNLLGIISDRDLLKSLTPSLGTVAETLHDISILNKKAHQIMSRQLITLGPDSTIKDAINIFNQHDISCIPIIDKDKKAIGVVSWRDIIKTL